MRKQFCIPKNDPIVINLLRNSKKNIVKLDKALVYMMDEEVILSSGNVLQKDLSKLEEVNVHDILNSLAILEPDGDNSVMTTKQATSKMLSKLQNRLSSVRNDLTSRVRKRNTSEEKEIYKRLEERKSSIKKDIESLESTLTDSQMLTIAENQLQAITTLLHDETFDLSKDELKDIDSTLKIFKDYTVNYIPKPLRTVKVVDEEGNELQLESELVQKSKNILNTVVQLEELFKSKDHRNAVNTFKHVVSTDLEKEKLFGAIVDENWWNSMTRQMVTSEIPIAQSVAIYIKLLNNKAKAYQKNLQDIFTNSYKDLVESSSLFKQYGFDLMYKKDADGKRTPYTITAYTDSFEKEFENENKIHKMDKEDRTPEMWNKYNKWKLENFNTISLINSSEEDLRNIETRLLEEYGRFGSKIYDTLLDKANLYKEEEVNARETLSDEEFSIWIKNNNPNEYLHATTNVVQDFVFDNPDANYKRFIYSFPKKQNINPVYTEIQNDVAYSNFYENFLDLVGGYVNDMPFSYTTEKGIVKNMIPYTEKSVSDLIFKEGNLDSARKKAWGNFLGYFTVAGSEESVYQEVDEVTGSHSLGVPVHFMLPLTKIVDGEVVTPIDTMETDLMKIAQMIIPQVAKYKYQMASLSTLEQTSRIIGGMQQKIGFNLKGGEEVISGGLEGLKRMLDNETKSFLGETSNKPEGTTTTKLMTSEQKATIEAIETKKQEALADLKAKTSEYLQEGEVLEENEAYLKLVNTITAKFDREKDSKTRFISIGKSARSIMKFYVFKTLGFSPSFAFEGFQSLMSVSIDAVGSELYDYKDYMGSLFNGERFTKDKNKNLRKLYNITASTEFGEQGASKIEKGAMWLAEQQDTLQKSAIMEAMMKKQKLQTKDGLEISLYDAYDDNGVWKSELFSENVTLDWNPNTDLDDTEHANNYYRFLDKIDGQNKRLFGAYGDDVYLNAKRNTVGKALMMFKSWLGEAIAVRFEQKKYRYDLDTEVKGRWRTLGEVFSNNSLKDFVPALFTGRTQGLVLIDNELDAANMKRNMVEMYILTGISVTALALGYAIADDDDEKDENTYLAMMTCLNLAGRIQQDILYYASPSEADKLVKNAVPVLKLYKDYTQLLDATYKTLNGNPTYKTGIFKNWGRIPKELGEFMPISNGALKYYKLANEDMTAYK